MIPFALSRADIADYVAALFLVYSILILLNILIGWIPRIPFYSRWFRGVLDFITETTDPYLDIFRRVVPSFGAFNFAPVIGLIVLFVIEAVVVGLIPRVSGHKGRAWGLAAALCGLVVIVDQIAKAVVEDRLVPGEKVDVLGPVGITLAHNQGVAFGLASGSETPLIVFAVLALAFVGYLLARNPTAPGMWIAVGLVAGGAIGNLIDRLRAGEVTDYIEIGSWPPFNVADIAITAGVVVFALLFIREEKP